MRKVTKSCGLSHAAASEKWRKMPARPSREGGSGFIVRKRTRNLRKKRYLCTIAANASCGCVRTARLPCRGRVLPPGRTRSEAFRTEGTAAKTRMIMNKKNRVETVEIDDLNALPEMLDGRHHVIPIVTGGDEVAEETDVPEILPILTLRSSVLFPGSITPITVGRDKSISLVRAVNAEGGMLGAVLQREGEVDDPAPDDMYRVGTAARIIKILEMPNGNLTVILNGLEKIEVGEYVATEPYLKARVTALRDAAPDLKSIEFEALVDSVRDVALGIINVSPNMPKEAAFAIKNIDSKRGIINFICSNLELSD